MAAPPPPPPDLPDDIVEEILLRLPPDDPGCLFRASLVCKAWMSAVSHPHFRRRFIGLKRDRAPPVLGFLHDWEDERIPDFVPTTASPFSLAAPDRRFWRPLDCRHGRALFLSDRRQETQELLLWEPTTGARQGIPVPAAFRCDWPTAAVFCTADGCDHRDCLGGPFRVLFIFSVVAGQVTDDDCYLTSACAYSSETGNWGEPTSLHRRSPMCFTFYSSVLVGKSLLYFMPDDGLSILECDLARHRLAVFSPPKHEPVCGQYTIMLAEDGGLGVCQRMNQHLKLWSREVSDSGDARWVLSRVVYLENLLPVGALVDADTRVQVLGFAEGANTIFLTTVDGIFMIELQSERVRRVCDDHLFCYLIPVVSFYTPVPRGEHRDPSSKHSEDNAGGEEQGGEEKTVYQVQQLINKMSQMLPGGTLSTPSNASTTP